METHPTATLLGSYCNSRFGLVMKECGCINARRCDHQGCCHRWVVLNFNTER